MHGVMGPQHQAPAGYKQAQWGSGFSTELGLLRLGSSGGDRHGVTSTAPVVSPTWLQQP